MNYRLYTLVFLTAVVLQSSCASMLGSNRTQVTVTSTPSEAHVLVDGVPKGKTPIVLSLHTNPAHPPKLTLVKKGYLPQNVLPQKRVISHLTFINLFNPLGYGIDWLTGAIYSLSPSHIETNLHKLDTTIPPALSEEPGELHALDAPPPEVVMATSSRFWWVYTDTHTYEDYRILKRVGNSLVLAKDRGAEVHVPLEEIAAITSEPRKGERSPIKTGLWIFAGGYIGTAAGMATGVMLIPQAGQDSSQSLFLVISGLLGAGLGAFKGALLSSPDEVAPMVLGVMVNWSLERKQKWVQDHVLD